MPLRAVEIGLLLYVFHVPLIKSTSTPAWPLSLSLLPPTYFIDVHSHEIQRERKTFLCAVCDSLPLPNSTFFIVSVADHTVQVKITLLLPRCEQLFIVSLVAIH